MDARTSDNGSSHKLAGLRPVELKMECHIGKKKSCCDGAICLPYDRKHCGKWKRNVGNTLSFSSCTMFSEGFFLREIKQEGQDDPGSLT